MTRTLDALSRSGSYRTIVPLNYSQVLQVVNRHLISAQVRHRLVISIKVFFVRLQAISCNRASIDEQIGTDEYRVYYDGVYPFWSVLSIECSVSCLFGTSVKFYYNVFMLY